MIRQMLKMLYNRRYSNILITAEIIISFLILFIVTGLITASLHNYFSPLGFSYKNIVTMELYGRDSLNAQLLKKEIKAMPEVEMISSANYGGPYMQFSFTGNVKYRSQNIKNVNLNEADDNFARVFNVRLSEGKWFSEQDEALQYVPVIINKRLNAKLFGAKSGIGEIIFAPFSGSKEGFKITGIIDDYRKDGEFSEPSDVCIARRSVKETNASSASFFIRVKEGTAGKFEEKLTRFISSLYPNMRSQVKNMESLRETCITPKMRQLIVFITIGTFLMINVALGLFGILWHNVSRRRQEIGIRRAVGANKRKIYIQITGEVLLLSALSVAIAIAFALQFSFVNIFNLKMNIYNLSLLVSCIVIYFVIGICAVYPSYLAAGIEPAEALRNE